MEKKEALARFITSNPVGFKYYHLLSKLYDNTKSRVNKLSSPEENKYEEEKGAPTKRPRAKSSSLESISCDDDTPKAPLSPARPVQEIFNVF